MISGVCRADEEGCIFVVEIGSQSVSLESIDLVGIQSYSLETPKPRDGSVVSLDVDLKIVSSHVWTSGGAERARAASLVASLTLRRSRAQHSQGG